MLENGKRISRFTAAATPLSKRYVLTPPQPGATTTDVMAEIYLPADNPGVQLS